MKKPLTKRQYQTLQALKSFIEQYGYSPTLDELAEKLCVSKMTTQYLIKILVQKGYVSHDFNKRQDYQVVNI